MNVEVTLTSMDDSGLSTAPLDRPMKCGVTQTETKPDQSNVLYPNELGLGRIRVMQEHIRRLCKLGLGQKAELQPELT